MKRKQTALILEWLQNGKAIDPMVALVKFNCMRLAARIYDLRTDGYQIDTFWKQTESGKEVAEYRLAMRKAQTA